MATIEYSIGVARNRFELFTDEGEDPFEILKIRESAKEAKKKSKNAPTSQAPSSAPQPAKAPVAEPPSKPKPKAPKRDEKKGKSQGPPSPTAHENESKAFEDAHPPKHKREFERKSGSEQTGVKHVDKREGGGSRNWGSLHDEIAEEQWDVGLETAPPQSPPDMMEEEAWVEEETPNVAVEESNADYPPPPLETDIREEAMVEEEPVTMTLDEWKALKGPKVAPTFNIRKAGEGEDLRQWKKMYALKKKKDETDEGDDYEFDISEYPQRVGRLKYVYDIEVQFKSERAEGGGRGGGRGGRGGGRGAGGRGAWRGNGGRGGGRGGDRNASHRTFTPSREQHSLFPDVQVPKVDDEQDFPALN